jgi:hypothetical protein
MVDLLTYAACTRVKTNKVVHTSSTIIHKKSYMLLISVALFLKLLTISWVRCINFAKYTNEDNTYRL